MQYMNCDEHCTRSEFPYDSLSFCLDCFDEDGLALSGRAHPISLLSRAVDGETIEELLPATLHAQVASNLMPCFKNHSTHCNVRYSTQTLEGVAFFRAFIANITRCHQKQKLTKQVENRRRLY